MKTYSLKNECSVVEELVECWLRDFEGVEAFQKLRPLLQFPHTTIQ